MRRKAELIGSFSGVIGGAIAGAVKSSPIGLTIRYSVGTRTIVGVIPYTIIGGSLSDWRTTKKEIDQS